MSLVRRPRQAQGEPLTPGEWAFFNDATKPDSTDDGEWWSLRHHGDLFREGRPGIAELWRQYRADVLRGWLLRHPGTRPILWWKFDAPEPQRHRIGGVGTPLDQCFPGHGQTLHCGLPVAWLSLDLAEYYRSKWPPFLWAPIDEIDPPVFESQAAYLDRHALLTVVERRTLKPSDFDPERLTRRPEILI